MSCSSFICLLRWFICFVVSLFELVCVVCKSVTALCDDVTMYAHIFLSFFVEVVLCMLFEYGTVFV